MSLESFAWENYHFDVRRDRIDKIIINMVKYC
jgi:hypothetical protein